MTDRTVLLVGTFLSHRQNRSVGADLALRLPDAGWRVLTTSHASSRAGRIADMVATAWRQRRRYDVAQLDVYSGAAFIWAEAVCWVLRRAGKPYVLTLHGGNLPTFAQRWPGRVRHLLAGAGEVTAPSAYLRDALEPFRVGIRLLPNPIAIENYPYRARVQAQPTLVWVRGFHRVYNPCLAVQVLAGLLAEHPAARLIMVGPDRDGTLAQVRASARELGVQDRVEFSGGVAHDQVPAWLARGDVFLNTTDVDNTPVSVIEAMACGLCVVSTNVGGVPRLVHDEHDGLLVPPRDPGAMVDAVRRVLTEPGLSARLSVQARRRAEALDWKVVLPQWDALLDACVR